MQSKVRVVTDRKLILPQQTWDRVVARRSIWRRPVRRGLSCLGVASIVIALLVVAAPPLAFG